MIVAIASGKGGTGKTTIAVNLALSLNNVQFLDCDVEEPNAHLFLKPCINTTDSAFILVPEINEALCTYCGTCQIVCEFNSIAVLTGEKAGAGSVLLFPHLCHGCGACRYLCPQKAIRETRKEIGTMERGVSGEIEFIHGILNVGEVLSPPLIRQVKIAIDRTRTVIIDAPPGTTCPVIEAVKDSDFCILVTEPTPFGLNDLVLAVDVLKILGIPVGVILNRADIGDDGVESYAQENDIPILMRIPFDREIALLYSQGLPFVDHKKEYREQFKNMYKRIEALV